MAYIVDPIIIDIMQNDFCYLTGKGRRCSIVPREEVEGVLKDFETNRRSKVHRDIGNSFERRGVIKGKDIVLEKIVELIGQSLTPLEGR